MLASAVATSCRGSRSAAGVRGSVLTMIRGRWSYPGGWRSPSGFVLTAFGREGERLPFADGSFDVVYSQGFIEHFPPDTSELLVAEHVRVLRPGGLVAVSVPNLLNPFHSWLKWREGSSYRFHPERSYTPRGLCELLERHGIRVMGQDGYGLFWSLWHQRSRLAYYTSALTLRLGFGQEFEAKLTPTLRAHLCMMTLAWGRRPLA